MQSTPLLRMRDASPHTFLPPPRPQSAPFMAYRRAPAAWPRRKTQPPGLTLPASDRAPARSAARPAARRTWSGRRSSSRGPLLVQRCTQRGYSRAASKTRCTSMGQGVDFPLPAPSKAMYATVARSPWRAAASASAEVIVQPDALEGADLAAARSAACNGGALLGVCGLRVGLRDRRPAA